MKSPGQSKNRRAAVDHPLIVQNWRSHPMMAVAGCIDSNGSISARATKGIEGHLASDSRGKRWRWIIHRQEFHTLPPKTLAELNNPCANELTDEEHFAVCDWLIRHGYADESILPD